MLEVVNTQTTSPLVGDDLVDLIEVANITLDTIGVEPILAGDLASSSDTHN